MKPQVKRVLTAFGALTVLAALLRLRGRGGRAPTGSGWREIDLDEEM
ncbi:MAG: hypothetical protein HYU28_06795 [Actinobacteria bacterium]|nr:hypothetical protein [Actinomycetota bacterium]